MVLARASASPRAAYFRTKLFEGAEPLNEGVSFLQSLSYQQKIQRAIPRLREQRRFAVVASNRRITSYDLVLAVNGYWSGFGKDSWNASGLTFLSKNRQTAMTHNLIVDAACPKSTNRNWTTDRS